MPKKAKTENLSGKNPKSAEPRISLIVNQGGGASFYYDPNVPGDNVAGAGTTNMTWDLR